MIMPFFVFQDTPLDEGIVEVIAQSNNQGKPIVCCASGGEYTQKMNGLIESRGVPVYPIPERAIAAVQALVRLGQLHGIGKPTR
jgi:acyl-CoA synthetase (NDP forming)